MNRKTKALVLGISLLLAVFMVAGGLGVSAASSDDGAYRQVGVYSEVLSRIQSDYVEAPNFAEVKSGALHGLLESLDPESSYMSAQEYAEYKSHKQQASGRIGITVSKRFGYAAVVAVLPGSPAAKAGVNAGDIIEAIDNKTTRELSVAEVRSMLAGDPGSAVNLTLVKPRKGEPDKFAVQRADVATPQTVSRLVEPGVGYIQPFSLVKGKAVEIANAVKNLQKQGATRIVLDLRDTAEGDPQEGVAVSNLFLYNGVITYLQGQKVPKQEFDADAAKGITNAPVAVLVNAGTAGPAEIVASALLDNARADVVGSKTFGVGSVQKTIELPDGAALLLSTAKFYTPGGKAIQDTAVTPNIVVSNEDDLALLDDDTTPETTPQAAPPKPREDKQMQRAVEVLKSRKA